jgi:colanic acid biosynthesis protein WcaH
VSRPDNDCRSHVAAILAAVPDPSAGLPDKVFRLISQLTPLVNVDLLIQDDRRGTLLTWRDDELFGSGWHVPGSIVRYKERLADRIHACARAELGTDVIAEEAPLAFVEGITRQRARGHHLSLLFRCRLAGTLDGRRCATADPPSRGQWRWHRTAPADLLAAQAEYAQFL